MNFERLHTAVAACGTKLAGDERVRVWAAGVLLWARKPTKGGLISMIVNKKTIDIPIWARRSAWRVLERTAESLGALSAKFARNLYEYIKSIVCIESKLIK